jgi:hypothetical protein
MAWIDLAQDRGQWRAILDTVMNFRVYIKYWEIPEQLSDWRFLKNFSA